MAKIVVPTMAALSVGAVVWLVMGQTGSGSQDGLVASVPGIKEMRAAQATNLTKLYNDTCSNCHGVNGEGGGGGTKTVLTMEKLDQKLDKPWFDAVKKGVPEMAMPSYGETLSDQEIWGLVVHMRELQGRWYRDQVGRLGTPGEVTKTKLASYTADVVVDENLKTPWSISWLPNGTMLLTNRSGTMYAKVGESMIPVSGIPESVEIGQGGLMEVAVHPDYAKNGWVYLSYAEPAKGNNRAAFTRVVRGKLNVTSNSATWSGTEKIWETTQDNYSGAGVHYGCKIVFDGKGHIYFSVGERGQQDRAQDLTRPNGKIYRVNEDGTIPKDNPFVNTPGAIPSVWSYGHRNPQGLVMDNEGNLWDTEHGPRGGDEVNLVKKGSNYGWPVVAFSINYNDSPFSTPWPKASDKITLPVYRWLPSIGASGLDVVRPGSKFKAWEGDLLAGGLSGQNVDRIRVKDGKLVDQERVFAGQGRVRDVEVGPDGLIYVVLNGPDRVVRLSPAN